MINLQQVQQIFQRLRGSREIPMNFRLICHMNAHGMSSIGKHRIIHHDRLIQPPELVSRFQNDSPRKNPSRPMGGSKIAPQRNFTS